MGELHHEETGPSREDAYLRRRKRVVSYACEIHIDLRVPDDNVVGGWLTEDAIENFAKCRGWVHSDRLERRGPEAKCVHLIYIIAGRAEVARRGLKGLISHLAHLEGWEGSEIALDSYVNPLLY